MLASLSLGSVKDASSLEASRADTIGHMARISLTLLGPFQARRGSGHSVELPGKPAALLAYLGLRPGRAHARDVLSTLLWSERGEEHARHSLRQALTALRQRLEGALRVLLLVDGDPVTLNPDSVDIDVVTFEGLAGSGDPNRLQQAIALYRGEFLEGCRNTDGSFGEWLMTERERLRGVAVGALTKLLAHQTDTWQDEAAIVTACRLLALEPFREAVHRTLMRVYGRQGRREDALRQYRACVAMLTRELGAEPEPETRQLYHQLLEQSASVDSRRAASSHLTNTTKDVLGERKQVTVLCADLKGSDLGPILGLMVEAVRRYEGTVTDMKPNGLTALFGVPLAHEDHAVRACRAALSMQRAVTRYSADVLRARGLGAHVRAGLNSGEVLVHSIGSDLRAEY